MKKICIPLAKGFEEIEAVTLIDVFRRAGFDVTVCGVNGHQVLGSHGIVVTADMTADQALEIAWDLVALPGGMPGATNLRDDPEIKKLLEKVSAAGGYIAAICAAPIVLAHHGFIHGKKVTSFPSFAGQMRGAEYSEGRVVFDGKILTSRGPGTAMEFALAITELLAGKDKADELREQMLIR
jgi:4-methyl-5(b-hydroxyethyl)-thiazole monophosphate biosynthesis